MSRYVVIFLLILLINSVLFFILPVINYEAFAIDEIVMSLNFQLILLASFIIAQLFYLIELVKKK
jgi:hypothetical protein